MVWTIPNPGGSVWEPETGGVPLEILVTFQHPKKWNSFLDHEEEILDPDFPPLESDPMEVSEWGDDVQDVLFALGLRQVHIQKVVAKALSGLL